jgi:CO/xanthine dehydrogenase Mo-binding subunit
MRTVIGEPVARTDGETKVRGEAVYSVDHAEPGMLHAKLLRSPVPAGVIRKLDVARAAGMPGVRAVATADDAPDCIGGWILKDQRLFAKDVVRFEGEPIAAVAADTLEEAKAALVAIELEIEPTPVVGDIESALAKNAPLVHPDWQSYEPNGPADHPRYGNVAGEMIADPDPEAVAAAFAQAALIVEDEYRAPRQYQAYLEPKSALARYENGRYIVHTAHQYPFNVRDRVAQLLGVRPSDVRVIGHHIGGGFGAKLDAALEPYAALLARLTGRPVKLVNDRVEDLLTCTCRENAIVRIRTALAADGRILGRELECLMDNGAYSGEMPVLTSVPLHVLGQVYRPGATRIVSKLVYTHTAPTGAFRGVGGLYLYFAIERHMDHCARELGLDRREFRLQNLLSDGDTVLNGQVLEDAGILREAFDRIEEVAPWAKVTKRKTTADGKLRGVGLVAATWLTNPMPGSVTLKLNEDGTVGLVTAATDNGSGAVTMGVTQIVAAELGIRPDDVVLLMPDTDSAAYDSGSQGSRTTHIVGRAAAKAATEVRQRILEVASELLEAASTDLELADGQVRVKGDPHSGVPLETVALTATFKTGPITGTGSYATPLPDFNPACASGLLFPVFPTPSYHVHFAEVEVDPVTGQVAVVRYIVAQEVGKAINPDGVRGQIQGGVAQGLGYALYENIQIRDGRYGERTLEQYRLPLAVDVPNVEFVLLEHPEPQGPYGARGVAEPPIVPVAAAVGNAVSDAIGRPLNRLPITPDDVLAALGRVGPSTPAH